MKKTIWLLSAILVLSLIIVPAATLGISAAPTPEGTPIRNATEFANMDPAGTYYLANNIIIQQSYTKGTFTGTFDGNRDNGVTVICTAPMFANFAGTAKNLTITGDIGSDTDIFVGRAAAVAATLAGSATFTNITTSVNICCNTNAAGIAARGDVSGTVASFTNCVNNGRIRGTVASSVAGIFGYTAAANGDFTFTDCVNNGVVIGGGLDVAGIFGRYNSNAAGTKKITITGCVNTADMSSSLYLVGGILSYVSAIADVTITNCENSGDITSEGNSAAGIFAHQNSSGAVVDITGCTNTGNVTAKLYAGGIAGYMVGKLTVKDCVNGAPGSIDALTIKSTTIASGGIVGRGTTKSGLSTLVENCENYGRIEGNELGAGGILSYIQDATSLTVKSCENYGTITDVENILSGTNTVPKHHSKGGIVAHSVIPVNIESCKNFGDIIARDYTGKYVTSYCGGMLGYGGSTVKIYDCYNAAIVNNLTPGADTSRRAGGIAGFIYGSTATSAEYVCDIRRCFNAGEVSCSQYTGGIAGQATLAGRYGKAYFLDCVNTGYVNTTMSGGGIIGNSIGATGVSYPKIEGCISIGGVKARSVAAGLIAVCNAPEAVLTGNYVFGGGLSANKTYALYNCAVAGTGDKSGNFIPAAYADMLMNEDGDVDMSAGYTDITAKLGTGELATELDAKLDVVSFYDYIADIFTFSTKDGAAVRLKTGATGLRFYTDIGDKYGILRSLYAPAQYKTATLITPAAYVTAAGALTKVALDTLNKNYDSSTGKYTNYLDVEAGDLFDSVSFTGSVVNLTDYTRRFMARGYVELSYDGNVYLLYSDTTSDPTGVGDCAADIAAAALTDTILADADGNIWGGNGTITVYETVAAPAGSETFTEGADATVYTYDGTTFTAVAAKILMNGEEPSGYYLAEGVYYTAAASGVSAKTVSGTAAAKEYINMLPGEDSTVLGVAEGAPVNVTLYKWSCYTNDQRVILAEFAGIAG